MKKDLGRITYFEPTDLWDILVDGLNAWWSHYQENNDAVVFKWNLYLTEKIN